MHRNSFSKVSDLRELSVLGLAKTGYYTKKEKERASTDKLRRDFEVNGCLAGVRETGHQ